MKIREDKERVEKGTELPSPGFYNIDTPMFLRINRSSSTPAVTDDRLSSFILPKFELKTSTHTKS